MLNLNKPLNQSNHHNTVAFFTLIISTLLVLYLFFGKFLLNPNQHQTLILTDGMKHYYAAAYHVKYDTTWHFTGMGYPFGEHFIYLDGHGIYSHILQWINHHIYPIHPYTVGILNFTVFFAVVFCSIFLFLILKKLNLPSWYAVLAALLITFLSPQLTRLHAHLSLGYLLFIPMIWYFLWQIMEGRNRILWSFLMVSSLIFFGFIHPYYLPIGAIFLLGFAFIHGLAHRWQFAQKWKVLGLIVVIAILPIVIFQVFILSTDFLTDRPNEPFGFLFYTARFDNIFLPNFGVVRDAILPFYHISERSIEAYGYVGLVGLACLITIVIRLIKSLFQKKYSTAFQFTNQSLLNQMFFNATLILVTLALAIPFKWFPALLDIFPFLKHFRSVGRFNWLFFYVYLVFCAYYVYQYFQYLQQNNQRIWAYGLLIGMAVWWGFEDYVHLQHLKAEHEKEATTNILADQVFSNALSKAGHATSDFQAILPISYYHIGSERFFMGIPWMTYTRSLQASYQLGLPIATHIGARAALSHTVKLLTLVSSDLIDKQPILEQFNNQKPLLLIVAPQELTEIDQRWIDKSTFITAIKQGDKEVAKLYELPLAAFETDFKTIQQQFTNKDSLYHHKNNTQNYWTTHSTQAIVIQNFDTCSNIGHPILAGKSSYQGAVYQHLLFSDSLKIDSIGQEFEVSLWVHINTDYQFSPLVHCDILDSVGVWKEKLQANINAKPEFFGAWMRYTFTFKAAAQRDQYRIYLAHNRDKKQVNGSIDNLLIRPTNVHVFYGDEAERFLYDGYVIPKVGNE